MRSYLLVPALIISCITQAQTIQQLSLQQAYTRAENNYPAISRKQLVQRTAEISIENIQKGFLPQFNLSGQASYQSDVTKVPISLPGLNIEAPSKDQYKLLADLSQLIYDGGYTRIQKEMQQLNAEVEEQKIDVELYQVKDRINQLFLGVLLIDQQLKQVELVKADILNGIKRVDAQVQNGVSFRSNLNLLKAELLKTDQKTIELNASRKGLLDALSLFIGQDLPPDVLLDMPAVAASPASLSRPELKFYAAQDKMIAAQKKVITAKNLPKASLFGQAGYGRPGLNMLKNDFAFYYIAGLRLNWSLSGLYTRKREREQVEINQKIIASQKETFLLNTNVQLKQAAAEIDKLNKLIQSDREIIELRHSVTESAKAQLENAVITATDYLNQVNAEDQARQAMILHQLQLLMAQITYKTILGE